MIRTLIRKEFSEHGLLIGVLLTFLGCCSLLLSLYVWLVESGAFSIAIASSLVSSPFSPLCS